MVEIADAGSRCARCEAPLGPRDPSLRLTQQWPHFPFCSERCRMIDLGHWVTGSYRIPGQSTLPPSGDPTDSDELD